MRILAVSLLAYGAAPTFAFAPSDSSALSLFGTLGRTHGRITTAAWNELAGTFFNIKTLTAPMLSALDTIVHANAAVDDDQTRAELHFDGESFPEGQLRLQSLAAGVKDALRKRDAPLARNLLGQALHSLQDFYTHTNWVELGNKSPHPDLGRDGVTIDRLGPTETTCGDCSFNFFDTNDCCCNIKTKGLTSGYYHGENRVKPMRAKCNHGGQFVSDPRNVADLQDQWDAVDTSRWTKTGDGINKDTRSALVSPHNWGHDQAADVATAASIDWIKYLKTSIPDDQLRLLFGVDVPISIMSDTNRRRDIARSFGHSATVHKRGLDSEIHTIQFNGRSVDATFMSPHAKHSLRRRETSSNTISGLMDSIVDTPRGSTLFIYADIASELVTPDPVAVASLAILMEIKVYVFLFGAGSGTVDADWYDVAHVTGGQLFNLGTESHDVAAAIVKTLIRQDGVDVFFAAQPNATEFSMPLDSTLHNVTFSLMDVSSMTLIKPDGAPLDLTRDTVSQVNLPSGKFVTVSNPDSGDWTVKFSPKGSEPVSVSITGSSAFDMGLIFTELRGRPGHTGYSPLWGRPASNKTVHAEAYVPNDDENAIFNAPLITLDRRDSNGTLLTHPLNLTGIANNTGAQDGGQFIRLYTADADVNVLPYDQNFFVYGNGIHNCSNERYQRLLTGYISPSWLEITSPVSDTIHPGSNRTISIAVTSHSNHNATIDVSIFDSLGYVRGGNSSNLDILQSTVEIKAGASSEIVFELAVPLDAQITDTDVIMVTAVARGEEEAFNFDYISQWIVEGAPGEDRYYYNGTMGYSSWS